MQRGGSKGTAAARRRRHEGKNEAPLSWPAPAARRVIASPGQASRVRPLLRAISTPPPPPGPLLSPEPGARSGPTALPPLYLLYLFFSSVPRRPPRALLVTPPPSQRPPSPSLFSSSSPTSIDTLLSRCRSPCFCVHFHPSCYIIRIIIIFQCFDSARVLRDSERKDKGEIREIKIRCNPLFVYVTCMLGRTIQF